MAEPFAGSNAELTKGTITRLLGEYGFITSDAVPDQDVYFKASWFRGSPPLQVGDSVSFQLKVYDSNPQAHYLAREANGPMTAESPPVRRADAPPKEREPLFEWAYLGYLPNTLAELEGLALDERWEFQDALQDPNRPLPILHRYLRHTFGRLALEQKVRVAANGEFAAFNTGLVDRRYEPIHALFARQDDPRAAWQLAGFCIPGEGADGQNLVRHFSPLPAGAHYFDNPADLYYDPRVGKPELDWRHIIIDRIDRYPQEFLEDHWPPGFDKRDVAQLSEEERLSYYRDLGGAIEGDNRTYRRIMNRVKDAVDLSIKRVSWNFKTAVPQYYPRVKRLQLLLPVCLISDDSVDLALAVEKTDSGNFLGHTMLSLDWAYCNARLVCRPDSDWLKPEQVTETLQADA